MLGLYYIQYSLGLPMWSYGQNSRKWKLDGEENVGKFVLVE